MITQFKEILSKIASVVNYLKILLLERTPVWMCTGGFTHFNSGWRCC